jgi:murein DD-endopeptidase MepM/ murein hydrolase activator NlpD
MNFNRFIILIGIFCINTLSAQEDYESELRKNRSRLDAIREEISDLKSQLSVSRNQALSISDQIALIDKEMSLIVRAKGLMQTEQTILQRRQKNNETNLKETLHKLQTLKDLYADRLRYMHKYGKIKNLELLLTSASFNQALVRYRYLKIIADYDEKTIKSINRKQQEIEQLQIKLADDLAAIQSSIENKLIEEQKYKERREERNSLLTRITINQKYFQNQINVKTAEQEKLTSLIASLESARKARAGKAPSEEFVTIDFENFNKGKGKLPWPVHGKITSSFGKQYDPVSKTSINNSGIEILSKIGTPVKNVFSGVVRMITYLGGYGNTIIIDHGNGYYTVYSHLGEIYVGKNDIVETNQIIALVGESGSLAGSKLHFEIYGGNQAFDPQIWLRK